MNPAGPREWPEGCASSAGGSGRGGRADEAGEGVAVGPEEEEGEDADDGTRRYALWQKKEMEAQNIHDHRPEKEQAHRHQTRTDEA